MSTNSARGRFRRSAARYRSVFVPDTSVWIVLPSLKRRRPRARRGYPDFSAGAPRQRLRPSRAEGIAALPARRPRFPTPGLADGQGCSTAPSEV